jgi:hypothetical protein
VKIVEENEDFVWVELPSGRRKGYTRRQWDKLMAEEPTTTIHIGTTGKRLHESDRRGLEIQLGKPVKTWDDVHKALAVNESRVVEKGDHVDKSLEPIRAELKETGKVK